MQEFRLNEIRSKYVLKQIVDNITKDKLLRLINFNKTLQKKLDISINDFKKYYEEIEIELIPIKAENKNKFINIDAENKSYYHIYFNDNKKEINKDYINRNDQVSIIKIIIDYPVESFAKLFCGCECVEYIYFRKFYRNNINT